jgi:hypothetical protein
MRSPWEEAQSRCERVRAASAGAYVEVGEIAKAVKIQLPDAEDAEISQRTQKKTSKDFLS